MSASFPPSEPRPDSEGNSDRMRAVARYSGIAAQMIATIGLSTWAGYWLDKHFQTKTPWFTLSLMLLGLFAALYNVIRSVTKEH
ncbi:F0F1-type ATP synthase assembly protein I [Hymenobacter luteus]|uniref:F0F1-type ATP synthase assembly protein I n=2 Tax=Hymenobacter TaxID=89966 RepID=A0A7W9T3X4_9BACT|nr:MULTISPECIES: AtpZ/AtpI family protein [Hymenobacter]MBB4602382.1 F0F1-type ATP synthase assembly protein I [Hymenobacter latericoloratus]MBB6060273.1 F0F1-type ATP synthase assembly protein I [Hymenobacter luteus]